jgi:hypothetical protein
MDMNKALEKICSRIAYKKCLFPVSKEGLKFIKKQKTGHDRLPSSYSAITILNSHPMFKYPDKDTTHYKEESCQELDSSVINQIQYDLEEYKNILNGARKVLLEKVGKEITIRNRNNKPKKVKLISVSSPIINKGYHNIGLPGTVFLEIIVK